MAAEVVEMEYTEETSRNWSPDPDINAIYIRSVQNSTADRLKFRGHIFLNDVLDELGINRTSRGQLIGWLMKPEFEFWAFEIEDGQPIKLVFQTQGEIYQEIES